MSGKQNSRQRYCRHENEQVRIQSCLMLCEILTRFCCWSGSRDQTVAIAEQCGAQVISLFGTVFIPKSGNGVLICLPWKHDWVFFVDADEIVTPELIAEIRHLFFNPFYYVPDILSRALPDEWACFAAKRPIVKLRCSIVRRWCSSGWWSGSFGDGRDRGHYQPVLKSAGLRSGPRNVGFGMMRWTMRVLAFHCHEKYAAGEAGMNKKNAWPGSGKMAGFG